MKKIKQNNPPQIINVLEEIRRHIDSDKFFDTRHAQYREFERSITLPDALHVLKIGRHEKNKTRFDKSYSTWRYAIRGLTVEKKDVRVIIAFESSFLVIITVMDPSKKD